MRREFVRIMNEVIAEVGITRIPRKYLNQKRNYQRHIKTIQAIKNANMSKGLDFGCGIGCCCVLGKLAGLNVFGIDIPTIGIKRIENRYVSIQKKLISMGYDIHIMDTTELPWSNFADNEFEFITFFWSINKQFMDKEWSFEDRIRELARITQKDGTWFIHPPRHFNAVKIKFAHLLEHINVRRVY